MLQTVRHFRWKSDLNYYNMKNLITFKNTNAGHCVDTCVVTPLIFPGVPLQVCLNASTTFCTVSSDTNITLACKWCWANYFSSFWGLFPDYVWQNTSHVLWTLVWAVHMVTIPTAAGRDPLDWSQWPGCCWLLKMSCVLLKACRKMFFHRFPLPSEVMFHSTISPICQSWLTAIRKWNVAFHLSRAFSADSSPACRLWREIEWASLAAVSARHLHKPMSLPPQPSTTAQAAPFCMTLEGRKTHKKCQSTAGKLWNPAVPSQQEFLHMDFQLATRHQLSDTPTLHHQNQHFWSYLRDFHCSFYQLLKFLCCSRALQAQQPSRNGFSLPFPCVARAAVAVARRRVAGASIVALALLGAVLPITTLRTRLTTDHALGVQKRSLRVGTAAWMDKEEMREDQGHLVLLSQCWSWKCQTLLQL